MSPKYDEETMGYIAIYDQVFKEEMGAAFKRIDERLKESFDAAAEKKGLSDEEKKEVAAKLQDQAKKTNANYLESLKKQLNDQ